MATEVWGDYRWNPGQIDADGHRTWKITYQVKGDHDDGPAAAVQTPGLPLPGDIYSFGNDLDLWAWCRGGPVSIVPRNEKGNLFFDITYTFSTRPPDASGPGGGGGRDNNGAKKKCADQRIEDPLSEPPSTSGSSIKYTREEEWDKNGRRFMYTSFERILGAQREFDRHNEQVVVEQNVVNLDLSLVKSLSNKLNDSDMWDLPARCWKLQDWSWQRKLYGTCNFYYTRRLVYESNAIHIPADDQLFNHPLFSTWRVQGADGKWWLPGWDHYVVDESTKVLNGHWHWINGSWVLDDINSATPDWNNPLHYINAIDRAHNPIRTVLSRTDRGQPMKYTAPPNEDDDANFIRMQRYEEDDHFQLNIPITL